MSSYHVLETEAQGNLGTNTDDRHSALFWLTNVRHAFPPTDKVLLCHPRETSPKLCIDTGLVTS